MDENRGIDNVRGESSLWLLGGLIFLIMSLASYSDRLDVSPWLFYAIAGLLTAGLLVMASRVSLPQGEGAGPRDAGRVLLAVSALVVLAEIIVIGLIMREWRLFTVVLPVTLLLFALLRLAGTHFVNRSLTLRFLLVPAAGLVLGILVALALPEVGFIDAFPLIFGLLSIGMGVWLALRPNSG